MFQPHSGWLRALVGVAVALTTGVSLVVAGPVATASPDGVSPALVSPVGSAAGVTPRGPVAPPGARAWLGQWRTNFGLVTFDDVYLAKSDAPDVHGNPQFYWRLVGTWAGHGRISGVLQAGFQTFGGCWKPADKAVSCGRILMYRSGNRISAATGRNAGTTAPRITRGSGSRRTPRWTLGFRFTQRGLPDGHRVIRTQTGGAGSIALATASDTSGNPVDGSRMFHVDEVIGAPMKMTVRLAGGSWDRVGRRMFLDLTGVVDSSEDSRIKRGSFVRVRLLDGRGLGPDRITIWFTTGFVDLPHSEEWTSTDPQRVNVAIGEPTRTV
jgi:hypothetical protein